MDALFLSRMQTAVSLAVHFVFPSLTLGMATFILIAETFFLRTKQELYRDISAFTVRLLAIVFAFGVATGLILPLSFGSNWAAFTQATGAVFGTNLLIEGLAAFMLESTFIGVLLFGRRRVGRGTYWLSAFLVFLGAHLSALIILATNSWLQTPFHDPAVAAMAQPVPDAIRDGFTVDARGNFTLTRFWPVFFNPSTIVRFLHTVTATWLCGAALMLGVSAWFLLRGRETATARVVFRMAATMAAVTAVAQPAMGHLQIMKVLEWQGAKSPAMEGIFATQDHAPLYALGWVDVAGRQTHALGTPGALSLLEGGSLSTRVIGLDAYPESDWPNVAVVFQTFHLMVLLGIILVVVSLLAAWFAWRPGIESRRWLLRACIVAVPLPVLANEAGWMTAEIGRQPWVVWKLIRTSHAASALPGPYVGFSMVLLGAVFVVLLILFLRWLPAAVQQGIRGGDHA